VATRPSPTRLYVERILELYRRTPGTSGGVRRPDRRLASALYDRQVPLDLVAAALLVATARRTLRPRDAPPLRPIASLHYFLPVIDELADLPLDPAYLRYLRTRLTDLAPAFLALIDHQLA
jgi:hypothetical protein